MIGIYKIENLINGKVYIGQSVDIETRWRAHKNKINQKNSIEIHYPLYQDFIRYGLENFSFEIIEECNIEELNEKEKMWINKYNSFYYAKDSNGYNLTTGGEGTRKIPLEDIEEMHKLWEKGKTITEISQTTSHSQNTIGIYLKNYYNVTHIDKINRRTSISNEVTKKKVNLYNIYGQFIKSYEKAGDIAAEFGANCFNIYRCIRGEAASYHDNYFIYSEENQQEKLIERMKKTQQKPLIQKDINENIIAIYRNCIDAANAIGNPSPTANVTIGDCCRKKIKSAYGYKWQYLYDYLLENNFDLSKLENFL